ncbi:SRPBCC family protein [Streptomyces sp. NBC_01233]|uniref:SRPBCC family protein n=1 Tax=Streptomyces sp. NBC_01233 TaxID=2903787 RepID=UPI002E0EA6B0|nr:SRPBCC family protein [Streptomyces sp. NBC_01233]
MSTLMEQIDIDAPAAAAWEQLHRFDDYPKFVSGLRHANTRGADVAHLDVKAGGRERELEATITDGDAGRVMAWETADSPGLKGEFTLRALDAGHTRVQVRLDYDPDAVRETFGGPKGFAQSDAIAQTVRGDLERFKGLVER